MLAFDMIIQSSNFISSPVCVLSTDTEAYFLLRHSHCLVSFQWVFIFNKLQLSQFKGAKVLKVTFIFMIPIFKIRFVQYKP